MDFLYGDISKLVNENYITWKVYETLPEAGLDYFMTVAVVFDSAGSTQTAYICLVENGLYVWHKL